VPGNLRSHIAKALDAVNMSIPIDRRVGDLSGGQQARLLLAYALIASPDILLLDEPTNNLDKEGIDHLLEFLIMYDKTVIVISHEASFLNAFTDGVLYLDVHTQKIEQYVGNYLDVVAQITARVEKENRKNAQLAKEIQENKDKANFFANKGGQMRLVARRMREKAEELEEEKVDIRKEDKTIRSFRIQSQPEITGDIITLSEFSVFPPRTKKFVVRKIGADEIGVEKIIPLFSPVLEKLEIVAKGKPRRAKLYYLRDRVGKSALKVKERKAVAVPKDASV
jgi:ATPase subunit of ABC transporter with duplicated ATPase domains